LKGKRPISVQKDLNKMKNKKYHAVGIIPKSNIKIVERDKFDTPNRKIHDHSLFLLDTCTSKTVEG